MYIFRQLQPQAREFLGVTVTVNVYQLHFCTWSGLYINKLRKFIVLKTSTIIQLKGCFSINFRNLLSYRFNLYRSIQKHA